MIYLARHGQTDYNLQKIFSGETEISLNQTGVEQSRQLAKDLENIKFDACFCSPQKRARETCGIIHGGEAILDARLAEIICGEFEGKEETSESFKQFFEASRTGSRGVEKFDDFLKRMCDFCDMLVGGYAGKDVLVVTHAANARAANYYFSGRRITIFLKASGRAVNSLRLRIKIPLKLLCRGRIIGGFSADVAQLVEQGFRKAKVGGSSPSIGTIINFIFSAIICASSEFFRPCTFVHWVKKIPPSA